MTEIILARHGETEWNVDEIFRGRADIDLNETGLKQAELLAEYLRNVNITAIYSSPLKRALNTSAAIARHHRLDVISSPGLIDINYGKWQGVTNREIQEKYPGLHTEWTSHPDRVTIPGGENLSDVRERATYVIDEVITECEGTAVLVSHRVVNKVMICALLGLDNSHFWNIRQDNCGITTFTHENGRFVLREHNNTSFLKSIQKTRLADF